MSCLTLESVAALAKSTFSLTWTFLLCSARVYNTLKIAFPQIKSRQSSRLISVNQRPFHLNIKDKKMLLFSKAKVGRHWASKFDYLIPDWMLVLFSVPSPFSKYPDKSNHNNQKNMYLDLPRERIYVCVQKFFLDLGTHNAKSKYLTMKKYAWICSPFQNILNQR